MLGLQLGIDYATMEKLLAEVFVHQGRSNLDDLAEWPKIGLLNPGVSGAFCRFSQGKTAKHRVH